MCMTWFIEANVNTLIAIYLSWSVCYFCWHETCEDNKLYFKGHWCVLPLWRPCSPFIHIFNYFDPASNLFIVILILASEWQDSIIIWCALFILYRTVGRKEKGSGVHPKTHKALQTRMSKVFTHLLIAVVVAAVILLCCCIRNWKLILIIVLFL